MCLVGVPGLGGEQRQVLPAAGIDPGHEAPEPQDPPQSGRAVAHGGLAVAAQLALAHPKAGGDCLDPGPGPPEQPGRLGHQPVRRMVGDDNPHTPTCRTGGGLATPSARWAG